MEVDLDCGAVTGLDCGAEGRGGMAGLGHRAVDHGALVDVDRGTEGRDAIAWAMEQWTMERWWTWTVEQRVVVQWQAWAMQQWTMERWWTWTVEQRVVVQWQAWAMQQWTMEHWWTWTVEQWQARAGRIFTSRCQRFWKGCGGRHQLGKACDRNVCGPHTSDGDSYNRQHCGQRDIVRDHHTWPLDHWKRWGMGHSQLRTSLRGREYYTPKKNLL
ncbi:hypothetical protein DPX16_12145 [Anabarilius grahami]|uniref:Uncharacterized protein n=1 Tax=Anabarilius grahami TaxID=495550 RepID=A0A3N0YQP3_ANAGA|nr:hypothetical protein DPX16_12145 [Anabarilius grahami]